jgi:hypothetical protein
MKTRTIPRNLLPAAALLVGLLGAGSPAFCAEAGAGAQPTAGTKPMAARPVLAKGMAAELIIQLIGKPIEVIPLTVEGGKAEKWIYRRVVDKRTTQTAATTHDIPSLVGYSINGPVIGTAVELDYHLLHVTIYQVTSLLVFDGHLVLAKQWMEKSQSIDS